MIKEKLSTCAVGLDLVISITFSPPVEASRRSRHRGFAQDPSTIYRSYGAPVAGFTLRYNRQAHTDILTE